MAEDKREGMKARKGKERNEERNRCDESERKSVELCEGATFYGKEIQTQQRENGRRRGV
jgi:hypothetical protein